MRAEIIKAARDFFDDRGFTLTDPPILTPAACEGTTTLFPVDYFDEQAYLTQSGQLYIEATAMALGKVYSFGPTFRAEKSKTRRHLTEFWMVEPEVAYADLDDIMELAEGLSAFIVKRVSKSAARLQIIGRDVAKLEKIEAALSAHHLRRAVQMLQEGHAKGAARKQVRMGRRPRLARRNLSLVAVRKPGDGPSLSREDESVLHGARSAASRLALCVDVLAPEGYGEIIGGSQRMASYELLVQRIQEHNLPEEAFKWYLDLRKYGSVPHAGFGMGIERAVAWICGLEHVRETIPFPRMLHRLYP